MGASEVYNRKVNMNRVGETEDSVKNEHFISWFILNQFI